MLSDEVQPDQTSEVAVDPWWRAAEHQNRETAPPAELKADETLIIPVVEEKLAIEKRVVETGRARIVKHVREHQETVDATLMQEEVTIQRVAINLPVDSPPSIRTEGDTTIYPVLEEVLVVEKRLMLKEEIHVIRTRHETTRPETVTLRSESVEIERDVPETN